MGGALRREWGHMGGAFQRGWGHGWCIPKRAGDMGEWCTLKRCVWYIIILIVVNRWSIISGLLR